ncbi:LOW QUALITY PROTEIN: GATOR complex protein NPRL3 [Carcharodon carcharias]|uniref:LOW QUALITY PROTEIN: GATOR complex protein NPRL3 n=1 Tax=Carcharodon carcharias TaxID=13397 RepID=UPI001B7E494E|nr:LOW QUALITY PROTEIN: GATOR complex protein NPRL3 [Carcharodon carcharias]
MQQQQQQQQQQQWGEDTNPISVILVSSGSRGNKLLFRFPFQLQQEQQGAQSTSEPQARGSESHLGAQALHCRRCGNRCSVVVEGGEWPQETHMETFYGLHGLKPSVTHPSPEQKKRPATGIRVRRNGAGEGSQSPFHHILPKCKLASDLKTAFDSLCTTGMVHLHINNWLELSFCLPHKIHRVGPDYIPPDAIERSLKAIRPYHALLLLDDEKSLLSQLPVDCSPALIRIIKTTSAMKNLQQLAQDADLALLQVFQLAAHLVYWGKAIVIYPLCENNFYMLSPDANICIYSPLAEDFSQQFPGNSLLNVLSKFSLPTSLSQFKNPLAPAVQEAQLVQMVIWMLQHRLLVQLHTYVCLMVPPSEADVEVREEDKLLPARIGGRSLQGPPNARSVGTPTSSDDMTLTSPSMDNSSAELLPGGDSPLNKRMTENLLASLSDHERKMIQNIPAAQNPEDLRMLAKLLHYFRGHHHLEEIMYNENMRRSVLLMLIDKFRSVLVVRNHEDPIISVFQSPFV